ncbi:hypothetical protein Tco_0157957 [Tanacetum coccineum]
MAPMKRTARALPATKTTPTSTPITDAQLKTLLERGVAAVLVERDAVVTDNSQKDKNKAKTNKAEHENGMSTKKLKLKVTDIRQKDEKRRQNDKTEHGMEEREKVKVKSQSQSQTREVKAEAVNKEILNGPTRTHLKGQVKLEEHSEPAPPLLKNLLSNNHPLSKHYIQNIRRYNMMFSFTSMGAKVDESINKGQGPYIYRIQGQNFHRMGSLVPINCTTPKFCQLYIYDTENEVSNRIKASSGKTGESSNKKKDQLNPVLIRELKALLDEINPLVKQFRRARDSFCNNANERFKIKLHGKRARDGRNYNLPEADEVAALIVGDIGVGSDKRDIVVQSHEGELQRISELHVLYLALQYPLIYARGEDGYRTDN